VREAVLAMRTVPAERDVIEAALIAYEAERFGGRALAVARRAELVTALQRL
jgi:hypothetical protein